MDVAIVAALVLAIPAVIAGNVLIVRYITIFEQYGRVSISSDGETYATFLESEQSRLGWPDSRPYGEFTLFVVQRDAGFPLTSLRRLLPIQADVTVFRDASVDAAEAMTSGHPMHDAIDPIIEYSGSIALHEAWNKPSGRNDLFWVSTLLNGVILWFGLYVVALVGISLVRVGVFFARRHRHVRERTLQAKGRCGSCGYDMRGLEFADRCPECGSLV